MLAPCFARHSHVHRSSKPCRASFSPEEVDPVSFLHTCVLLEDPLSPVFCEADLCSSSPALLVPSSSRDPVSLLEAVVRPAHPSFSIYPVAVSPLAWHPFGVLESYCAQAMVNHLRPLALRTSWIWVHKPPRAGVHPVSNFELASNLCSSLDAFPLGGLVLDSRPFRDVLRLVAWCAQTTGYVYELKPPHGFSRSGIGDSFPRTVSMLHTFDSLSQVGSHLLKPGRSSSHWVRLELVSSSQVAEYDSSS